MSASTPTNKKPGVARRTPAQDATVKDSSNRPSPSTSRTSTPTLTNGLDRSRSVRNGAPISARAAARKTPTADDDAKAELLARMEDLQEKMTQAELASVEKDKQAANLQAKLDLALKEQGMLEESVHEQTERIEELENDKKESVRARRELEQIYESERAAILREKEEAATREEEMQKSLQRMKEALAQREMRAGLDDERRPMASRSTSHGKGSAPSSPSIEQAERQFAPSSMQRSDSVSRSNSKLVMQKDKIIESLRLELAEAQIKLVEMENMGGGRLQELQNKVYETKMQNARLMEENESFQLLLSEKTLNGDFLRPGAFDSRPPSRSPADGENAGTSLADELGSEEGDSETISETTARERRLRAEVNAMKDQNKALTLYINNIISRLLQHEQFEQILDKTPDLMAGPGAISRKYAEADTDKELPPPPPEEDEQPSLLQRARSVIAPKRPRPTSQQMMPPPSLTSRPSDDVAKPNEDPETAPSVPIGRRMASGGNGGGGGGGGGHRRANSDWPAASVVTNMYRPGPQSVGPLSPGLSSPTNRTNSFFAQHRTPSGNQIPTVSDTTKENSAPRDSKMLSVSSNRTSISSHPGTYELLDAPESVSTLVSGSSNPSSPPRSTTSSGNDTRAADKDGKGMSGAVMMGSKPRPLRLVQEAKDEDNAKKNANRASWFGWMNKGSPGLGGGGE
ncbi:unnamed protein product [Zymoseptoria tritici ST99CH_1A5]|uniref:M serotype protein n=3 Tax=Zymoseptoria tritici TaxID=1047171 RepID=A0A1X7RXP5_ZYMT9|nr:unnamed protein product [Zymoseptoria tritici ST99CH_3D7]SMR54538.1 unnamed protein product [Zymoseptoria tritici ST99CH_1E4]SMY25612.1 unnamed protein product [Zymoseptoria tritici ST99CH_1A5]